MTIETYPEMDAKIVGILRVSDDASKLYAAQLIENLECELEAVNINWSEAIKECRELRHKLQRAEAALRKTRHLRNGSALDAAIIADNYFKAECLSRLAREEDSNA